LGKNDDDNNDDDDDDDDDVLNCVNVLNGVVIITVDKEDTEPALARRPKNNHLVCHNAMI